MENKFYGIFKRLATENHYTDLTKALNSAAATRDTRATMKSIAHPGIQYGHMGELIIKDDVCYATFIENSGTDGEAHYSKTSGVVLAIFPLERVLADDFVPANDVKIHKIGSLGDSFAGYKSISIFKCTSMYLIGDLIHIVFNFQCEEDKRFRVFSVVYDIKQDKFLDGAPVKLRCGEEICDLTDEAVNRVYEERGFKRSNETIVEVVSQWSEYKGEYYTTFLIGGTPNNGLFVKTADFKTFDLVDVIPNNALGTAEAGCYIYKDVAYIACRQAFFQPYMVLNAYELKTKKWHNPTYIEDGTCRPWFFEKNGDLYLVNTIEEYHRRYTNISKFMFKHEWEEPGQALPGVAIDTVATLYDCGFYFAITEYKGKYYFLATKGIMYFGELKLTEFDTETVNKKLLDFFEN